MNWKSSWKAILAFGALLATNVATQLTTASAPWPTDGGEWLRFALTTAGGTWLVWQGPRNKPKRRRRAASPTS